MEPKHSEAQAVLDIAKAMLGPDRYTFGIDDELDDSKLELAILPNGKRVEDLTPILDRYRIQPRRLKGLAILESQQSLIDHVKRFADERSALFAESGKVNSGLPVPQIIAVYNYATNGTPEFCDHRASYTFPLSDEWIAWRDHEGKWLSQEAFAQFVEDHLLDVIDPSDPGAAGREMAEKLDLTFADPAQLLHLSRGLALTVQMKGSQRVNLSSGVGVLTFSEEHHDDKGQELKVPGAFLIGIPVFRHGKPWRLPVRLRYRVNSGRVLWSYNIHRADRAFTDSYLEVCHDVQKATGVPMFHGYPDVVLEEHKD